jgi:hypothetical protein
MYLVLKKVFLIEFFTYKIHQTPLKTAAVAYYGQYRLLHSMLHLKCGELVQTAKELDVAKEQELCQLMVLMQ